MSRKIYNLVENSKTLKLPASSQGGNNTTGAQAIEWQSDVRSYINMSNKIEDERKESIVTFPGQGDPSYAYNFGAE